MLEPNLQLKPGVHYLNISRKFISSTVYGYIEEEVIIGAACTLSSNGNKMTATNYTFDNFWFERLGGALKT